MTGNCIIYDVVWCGYLKRQDNKKIKDILYSYSSSRLLMPRGSIVLALWIRWALRAFRKHPFLSFSIEGLDWSFKKVTIANVSFYSELYLRGTVISVLYYSTWSFWPCTNENKTVKGALNCPEDSLSCAEDSEKTWDFIGEDLFWWFYKYSIKTWKKWAQIFQLFHLYHNKKQFKCLKIVLYNKTGSLLFGMQRHVLNATDRCGDTW